MPEKNSNVATRAKRVFALLKQLLGVRGMFIMLASSLLVSIIELAGLALIFPFIKLVTDLAFHQRIVLMVEGAILHPWLTSHQNAIALAGGALVALFLAKGFIHNRLIRYQASVAAEINTVASCDLIDTALQSRYQLFLVQGAVKIAGVSYSNTTHAALLFQSLVSACNELLLLSFVFAAIVVLSPLLSVTLVALMALLAYGVFIPFSRRVAQIGQHTQAVDLARHRFVFAMASAIRDIKIMGLELSFSKRNRTVVEEHARLSANYLSIAAAQRIAVEVLMVCGVVLGCVWLGFSGRNLVELAPFLATVGLVAVRAAPALSRLVGAYSGFRYSLPFVEGLLEMRDEISRYPQPREEQSADFPGDYAVHALSFSYGATRILQEVSLNIPFGHVVAVVGPSGSGKSTLLDLIAGLQPPAAGHFTLGGMPFDPFRSKNFCERVGYVPQNIALLDATLQFNISLEDEPDSERLNNAIRQAHLSALVSSLPLGLQTFLGEGGHGVSGGQRQRIGIARALYREPALLILDEVTSSLDAETESAVMQDLLQLRGRTSLLIVTHRRATVASADSIYRIEEGRLLLDSAQQQPGAEHDATIEKAVSR